MRRLAAVLLAFATFAAHAGDWMYTTKKDATTDQLTTQASLKSLTTLKLWRTYGTAIGDLVVDATAGQPNRIRLLVSTGQLLESEGLVPGIDDEPPLRLRAVTSADGAAHALSVVSLDANAIPDLAARIAAAGRLRVQATFNGAGQQVFEFNPSGMKLD